MNHSGGNESDKEGNNERSGGAPREAMVGRSMDIKPPFLSCERHGR